MQLDSAEAAAGRRRLTAAGARSPAATAAAGVLVAALLLYLLSPAATATHVEGFTALIAMNAIAAHQGLIDRADLLYPVQTEYFYLTRQGVVLLLRGLMSLTGTSGDGLFRVLTQASFVVFLGSTAGLARRYGRLPMAYIVAALALLPGLFELGFFFSDSIVAAGFGLLGLALLPGKLAPSGEGRGPRAAAGWAVRAGTAGVALALAALARTDALVLLPLAAALVWHDQRGWRSALAVGAVLLAGMATMFWLSQVVSGTTILQSLQTGRFFTRAHGGGRWPLTRAAAFVLFFGLPGLVLIAIGLRGSARAALHRHRWPALAAVLLLLAWALRSATELRQAYPLLAPFAVIVCGRGLQTVVSWLRSPAGWRFAAGGTVVAFTALAGVLPPLAVVVRDGPRAVVGRLWSPPLWQDWQRRVDASLLDVQSLVERAETGPGLVAITAHFNTDHYFQLRAWQRGWVPLTPEESGWSCPVGVQVWGRGSRRLVQVRVENPYGLAEHVQPGYFIPLQLAPALACPAVLGDLPVYFSDFEPTLITDPAGRYLAARLPAEPAARATCAWPAVWAQPLIDRVYRTSHRVWALPPYYGLNRSVLLSRAEVLQAQRLAAGSLANFEPGPLDRGPPFAEFQSHFRNRSWVPPNVPPVLRDSSGARLAVDEPGDPGAPDALPAPR